MVQDDSWVPAQRTREGRIEQRLSHELSVARGDGAALTLILVEPVTPPKNRPAAVSTADWSNIAARRLLVGDDWAQDLTGERKAFCLTHTGPESNAAICTILDRLSADRPLAYGIAYYPMDAKNARRLLEVAGRRLESTSPVTASSR